MKEPEHDLPRETREPPVVVDVGEWRGPSHEEWLERMSRGTAEGTPARLAGEVWPMVKPKEIR